MDFLDQLLNFQDLTGTFSVTDVVVSLLLSFCLTALIGWLCGGHFDTVPVPRAQRSHGKSRFHLRELYRLGMHLITAFSDAPVQLMVWIGGAVAACGGVACLGSIVSLFRGEELRVGDLVGALVFFGGVQLFSLGLIGEYISRIYMETKRRPRYIVEDELG